MMLSEHFATSLSGPAYTRAFKAASTAVLLLIVVQAIRLWGVIWPALNTQGGWILIGGFFVLLGSYALLLRSRTTIDAEGLRQTGIMDKTVAWSDIKVARLRGFPFARRLVVSTGYGRLRAFYAGTPELEQAFARIGAAYARPAAK
jgi:hypothetical protein